MRARVAGARAQLSAQEESAEQLHAAILSHAEGKEPAAAERDVGQGQEVLGVAVAAGVLVVGEAVVRAAAAAGRWAQRWASGASRQDKP